MTPFLKSKRSKILKLVQHAENLGILTQKRPNEYTLCHSHSHGWNLRVDAEGALYILDWDTLIFAPKERDLMCIGSGIWDARLVLDKEESLFYKGYGQITLNQEFLLLGL